MNKKTVRRLVWLAVLSYLAPPVISADGCRVTTAVVEGVCASGGIIVGVVGGVLCGVTAGIGCIASVVGSIAASTCASAIGKVNCGNPGTSAGAMVEFMKEIQDALADVSMRTDLGAFESTYNNDINTIRMSLDRYDRDIIEKSSKPGNKGYIVESKLVNDWMEDILGDGNYDVRGALDMIEDMIEGRPSITTTPSVYELAEKHDICGPRLYKFITNLVTGGSTVVFVALEMKGYGVHEYDKKQLEDRLILNANMFSRYCPEKREWCYHNKKYLSGYAKSSGQNRYNTLLRAQQQCLVMIADCWGVTYEPSSGKYTLRKERKLKSSSGNEITWKRCSKTVTVPCSYWTGYPCNSDSGCSFGCFESYCWKQCDSCSSSKAWCYQDNRCRRHHNCDFIQSCNGKCG